MSTYIALVEKKRRNGEVKSFYFKCTIDNNDVIVDSMMVQLLRHEREKRFNKLKLLNNNQATDTNRLFEFTEYYFQNTINFISINNAITLNNANNTFNNSDNFDNHEINNILEQMYSLYEFCKHFRIISYELEPKCDGCKIDHPSQRRHMDCENGCMHDISTCSKCSK